MVDIGKSVFTSASQTLGAADRSYVLPAIAAVIAIAIIIMVVYVSIQTNVGKPAKQLMGPIDIFDPKSPVLVDRATSKVAMAASYTLSYYVNINAVPDLRAPASPILTWPGAWVLGYNAAQEQLLWSIITSPDVGGQNWDSSDTVVIPKVPLQRWNQLTMTLEGRTVDFYLNGKLIKSQSLTNVPPAVAASVVVVPKEVIGQIAYVQIWPRRLTSTEVSNNYLDTCDSRGRPYLGPELLRAITDFKAPNLFCPNGECGGKTVTASPSQQWVFPYQ